MEAGFDYLGGTDYPWFFDGKIGIEEKKLFSNAPSFSIGAYNIGLRKGITNFNIFNAVIGKTLPNFLSGGRLFLGAFIGTRTIGKDLIGYMIGYAKSFYLVADHTGKKYPKCWIVADYASGKNSIGGGGIGFAYFFNPYVFLVVGPTFFNDAHINGRWKLTIQIDVIFPIF